MNEIETGFDFEAMAELARDDPEEFERVRAGLLSDLIRGGRQPEELARLQQTLEAERSTDANLSAESLSQTMWNSFGKLTQQFDRLVALSSAPPRR